MAVMIDGYGNMTKYCDGCDALHRVNDAFDGMFQGRCRPGLRCLHYGHTMGEIGSHPERLENCTAYHKKAHLPEDPVPGRIRNRFQLAIAKAATMAILCVALSHAQAGRDTVTVRHIYYTATYDTVLRYPVRVQWCATQAMLSCRIRLTRATKFMPDPTLPAPTNVAADYRKSGYDKGHNMPAFDNECNAEGENECFYFSNITPQTPRLNRGDWKMLEDYTRNLVMEHDSVWVQCGSVGAVKKIGRVSVPAYCWKVLRDRDSVEAYLFTNDTTSKPLAQHRTTLDFLRKLTGLEIK